ncbi:hypothetical protein BGX38DRAFT_1214466, partial [Terfezia claveryi]
MMPVSWLILRTTINIERFLRTFESLLPPELIGLYTRHDRPDGVTVSNSSNPIISTLHGIISYT